MQEGYSTATEQIREMGFGGEWDSNMKKCSDQFEIHSDIEKRAQKLCRYIFKKLVSK